MIYHCILPLIFNKVGWFKFFVGRKENHFILFYHLFYLGDSIRHEWHAKKCLSVKYWKGKATGRLLQPLECCYFDRGTKMILREFSYRNDLTIYEPTIDLYDIYYFIASLIVTRTSHCSLYLIQIEWSTRLE